MAQTWIYNTKTIEYKHLRLKQCKWNISEDLKTKKIIICIAYKMLPP